MEGLRVLGVDPGLNTTGYGVIVADERRPRLAEAGGVRGASARSQLADRVHQIYQGITEVLQDCRPDVMAIEELYSHYKRPQTAILMGHARGAILLAAAQIDIPVMGYSATRVKKILTGSGHAPKLQVQQAVQRELQLNQIPDPPDIADALAIAMCHYFLRGKVCS